MRGGRSSRWLKWLNSHALPSTSSALKARKPRFEARQVSSDRQRFGIYYAHFSDCRGVPGQPFVIFGGAPKPYDENETGNFFDCRDIEDRAGGVLIGGADVMEGLHYLHGGGVYDRNYSGSPPGGAGYEGIPDGEGYARVGGRAANIQFVFQVAVM